MGYFFQKEDIIQHKEKQLQCIIAQDFNAIYNTNMTDFPRVMSHMVVRCDNDVVFGGENIYIF